MQEGYQVKALVRNMEKAEQMFGDDQRVEVGLALISYAARCMGRWHDHVHLCSFYKETCETSAQQRKRWTRSQPYAVP